MSVETVTVIHTGHVATIVLNRPPHNFADADLLRELAEQLEVLDADANCRAVVLASDGKTFCAGADFSSSGATELASFYTHAMRLFRTKKPIVAAVHGAAIGAGLGLALVADFRVTCESARYSASFTRLGFHPGFGLTVTLPHLIGEQKAALLFYTGRRIDGAQAFAMGLADELVPEADVRARAMALAQEIAIGAPLAIISTRSEIRRGLADRVTEANLRERGHQELQFATADFKEGVTAMAERRAPVFSGK
ncbi:enoyl-CoA hydratase/isomerase family protein [Ottowia thiooxydans]|uniref:enoyl-CoA hydratase/isomerase family protein n=1 Tax=Ottowia thiooxydans TaxID=219182 RepID=UPI0004016468|nr:enoyl-CoA hydratase/isomerase family protein [Ottowia thiooxydans]